MQLGVTFCAVSTCFRKYCHCKSQKILIASAKIANSDMPSMFLPDRKKLSQVAQNIIYKQYVNRTFSMVDFFSPCENAMSAVVIAWASPQGFELTLFTYLRWMSLLPTTNNFSLNSSSTFDGSRRHRRSSRSIPVILRRLFRFPQMDFEVRESLIAYTAPKHRENWHNDGLAGI